MFKFSLTHLQLIWVIQSTHHRSKANFEWEYTQRSQLINHDNHCNLIKRVYELMYPVHMANAMAMLPVIPFYSNNTITYAGPFQPLLLQLSNLTPADKQGVKVLNLNITGEMVQ